MPPDRGDVHCSNDDRHRTMDSSRRHRPSLPPPHFVLSRHCGRAGCSSVAHSFHTHLPARRLVAPPSEYDGPLGFRRDRRTRHGHPALRAGLHRLGCNGCFRHRPRSSPLPETCGRGIGSHQRHSGSRLGSPLVGQSAPGVPAGLLVVLEGASVLAVVAWLVLRTIPAQPDLTCSIVYHFIPFLSAWLSMRIWTGLAKWGRRARGFLA